MADPHILIDQEAEIILISIKRLSYCSVATQKFISKAA